MKYATLASIRNRIVSLSELKVDSAFTIQFLSEGNLFEVSSIYLRAADEPFKEFSTDRSTDCFFILTPVSILSVALFIRSRWRHWHS